MAPAPAGAGETEGGASVYVTPHGEMLVYCSQCRTRAAQDPRLLRFAEYTPETRGLAADS
jgi:hypothetical protein